MHRFHVRISKEDLVFSAGHFITLAGGTCERMHGHNYRVAAEVHGPLDENHYVVDFLAVRETLRSLVGELDHRVLLPAAHPLIRVTSGEAEVEVTFGPRRWTFPRSDCVILPLANTTSELLAHYLAKRLLEDIVLRTGRRPERVRIEVEETPGFSAVCELSGD